MTQVIIKLTSAEDIKSLVHAATEHTFDIDLLSGKYIIDAKSLMGIFSLDFNEEIKLNIYADLETAKPFLEKISALTIK